MIALRLALIFAGLACAPCARPAVPCEPTCRGGCIVACGRVVLDCARTGAVCEVEPGGVAVCVEGGGARPFP
jgi:hypothetical protein